MIVPKYQWLIEEKAQGCNKFCDKLMISNTFAKKFQVSFTPETLVDEDFDGDDINYPLDGTTYVFDISAAPSMYKEYVNSFTFTYNGQDYCYIFHYDDALVGFYSLTQYGDFYLVTLNPSLHKNTYRNAVNDYLSEFGVSASHDGTNMTLTGLPTGTQVDIAVSGNYPTVSGITGDQTWGLNNFLPINDKVCFFQISGLDTTPGATSTPSIFKEVVIGANNRVIVTVQFTNSFGFDVDLDFTVRDNSFTELEVITKTAEQGTNTLQFCFTADASPPPYYILEFLLSDPSAYTSSIVQQTVGFCYNHVTIEEVGNVGFIFYNNCEGEQNIISEWTATYTCGYNALVEITEELPTNFQLYILGSDGGSFISKWYEQIDPDSCLNGQPYRLAWTDTCQIGDLDYRDEDLQFTNELYVTGVLIKTGLDKVEAIANITSTGKKTSVYRHTIEQYEFRVHPYTAETMQAIERAFEHSTVYIGYDQYYVGDGGLFTVSEIDQFIYTGRVDLYLSGSEVIKSSCCC